MVADLRQFVEGLTCLHAHHMCRALADVHLLNEALALRVVSCCYEGLSVFQSQESLLLLLYGEVIRIVLSVATVVMLTAWSLLIFPFHFDSLVSLRLNLEDRLHDLLTRPLACLGVFDPPASARCRQLKGIHRLVHLEGLSWL